MHLEWDEDAGVLNSVIDTTSIHLKTGCQSGVHALLQLLLLLNVNLKLDFLGKHLIIDSEHFIRAPGQFHKAVLHKFHLYCIVLYQCICG